MLNSSHGNIRIHHLLISTLLFLSFSFWSEAQESILSKNISVEYKKSTLNEVLEDINFKTGVQFSYNPKVIPLDRTVSYSAKDKSLQQILNDIFKIVEIQYQLVGNYLVLKKRNPIEIIVEEPKQKKFTLSGYIVDSKNNESLIGAAVYIKETGIGTLTNNYGYYSLTLSEGKYNIATSYLGYSTENKSINLYQNIKWNINFSPTNSLMEEIIISSFDREELIFKNLAGQTNIEPFEVKQQTAVLGESDMLKSLEYIPGITYQNDGSSYFYTRGGNRDQNLILLDEATIYNPSHLLGLFSTIIPEAVKSIKVYKADFPVEYGGRLSSVIDVRTKDGNMQKTSGGGGIGLLSTRINIEGPIKKNASSYFISYRRSHLGMFLKKINKSVDEFYFSDFTSKLNFRIGSKDRLFLTVYNGKDNFLMKDNSVISGLEWGNSSFTLRWNHIFGNKLFSNTTFYTSKYNYSLYTDYKNDIYWKSHISSTNIKTDLCYYLNQNNKIKFGVNIGSYFFNPGNSTDSTLTSNHRVSRYNSGEFIYYLGNEQEITSWFTVNYSIRAVYWGNIGETFIVNFDNNYQAIDVSHYSKGERYYSDFMLEPGLSFSVKTSSFSSLKASYNRTTQHINLINNSISPFNSLEVWLPTGPNIKPQTAHIVDFGYIHAWPKYKLEISFDIYAKLMRNQIGYTYHGEMLLNPAIEGEIRQGNGNARGVEITLKRTLKRLTGMLSFAHTRSSLTINGLNNNKTFLAKQDKPFELTLMGNYKINKALQINCGLNISSGIRITTPTGFYYYNGYQIPSYTEQNNSRLPTYKRIDIGATIRLNKYESNIDHYLNISIFNFFGYKNPAFLNFNKAIENESDFIVPADRYNNPELVTTYRNIFTFVPSINYNLSF